MIADNVVVADKVQKKTSVLCVDDHWLVRDGLTLIVNRMPDMAVVASAASGEEAIAVFRAQRPAITLMDLQLPVMSGIDAIREIRQIDPVAKIIVLTVLQGDEDVYRALQAGACTYLLKDTVAEELIRVIREVREGKYPVTPYVQSRLDVRRSHPGMSARELQVLGLIAEGMRNREIGASLGISEETVQVHVKHILEKLRVKDRSAAITAAIRRGIIHV